jgi:hypothetical protein
MIKQTQFHLTCSPRCYTMGDDPKGKARGIGLRFISSFIGGAEFRLFLPFRGLVNGVNLTRRSFVMEMADLFCS